MLESGLMLVFAWIVFGQIAGFRYSRQMVFRLFMKYQTHYEVIISHKKYWLNDGYWIVNSMMHYALFTFLAVFTYAVIGTIFNLPSNIGWYVAYITLFLSIWQRSRNSSKDNVYKKTCDLIDNFLDASGYSLNIADFHINPDIETRKGRAFVAEQKMKSQMKNSKPSPSGNSPTSNINQSKNSI